MSSFTVDLHLDHPVYLITNVEFGTEPFKYFRKSKLFGVIFLASSLPMLEKNALNELAISLGDVCIWPLVLKKALGSD